MLPSVSTVQSVYTDAKEHRDRAVIAQRYERTSFLSPMSGVRIADIRGITIIRMGVSPNISTLFSPP
jgi:hypothetical protein